MWPSNRDRVAEWVDEQQSFLDEIPAVDRHYQTVAAYRQALARERGKAIPPPAPSGPRSGPRSPAGRGCPLKLGHTRRMKPSPPPSSNLPASPNSAPQSYQATVNSSSCRLSNSRLSTSERSSAPLVPVHRRPSPCPQIIAAAPPEPDVSANVRLRRWGSCSSLNLQAIPVTVPLPETTVAWDSNPAPDLEMHRSSPGPDAGAAPRRGGIVETWWREGVSRLQQTEVLQRQWLQQEHAQWHVWACLTLTPIKLEAEEGEAREFIALQHDRLLRAICVRQLQRREGLQRFLLGAEEQKQRVALRLWVLDELDSALEDDAAREMLAHAAGSPLVAHPPSAPLAAPAVLEPWTVVDAPPDTAFGLLNRGGNTVADVAAALKPCAAAERPLGPPDCGGLGQMSWEAMVDRVLSGRTFDSMPLAAQAAVGAALTTAAVAAAHAAVAEELRREFGRGEAGRRALLQAEEEAMWAQVLAARTTSVGHVAICRAVRASAAAAVSSSAVVVAEEALRQERITRAAATTNATAASACATVIAAASSSVALRSNAAAAAAAAACAALIAAGSHSAVLSAEASAVSILGSGDSQGPANRSSGVFFGTLLSPKKVNGPSSISMIGSFEMMAKLQKISELQMKRELSGLAEAHNEQRELLDDENRSSSSLRAKRKSHDIRFTKAPTPVPSSPDALRESVDSEGMSRIAGFSFRVPPRTGTTPPPVIDLTVPSDAYEALGLRLTDLTGSPQTATVDVCVSDGDQAIGSGEWCAVPGSTDVPAGEQERWVGVRSGAVKEVRPEEPPQSVQQKTSHGTGSGCNSTLNADAGLAPGGPSGSGLEPHPPTASPKPTPISSVDALSDCDPQPESDSNTGGPRRESSPQANPAAHPRSALDQAEGGAASTSQLHPQLEQYSEECLPPKRSGGQQQTEAHRTEALGQSCEGREEQDGEDWPQGAQQGQQDQGNEEAGQGAEEQEAHDAGQERSGAEQRPQRDEGKTTQDEKHRQPEGAGQQGEEPWPPTETDRLRNEEPRPQGVGPMQKPHVQGSQTEGRQDRQGRQGEGAGQEGQEQKREDVKHGHQGQEDRYTAAPQAVHAGQPGNGPEGHKQGQQAEEVGQQDEEQGQTGEETRQKGGDQRQRAEEAGQQDEKQEHRAKEAGQQEKKRGQQDDEALQPLERDKDRDSQRETSSICQSEVQEQKTQEPTMLPKLWTEQRTRSGSQSSVSRPVTTLPSPINRPPVVPQHPKDDSEGRNTPTPRLLHTAESGISLGRLTRSGSRSSGTSQDDGNTFFSLVGALSMVKSRELSKPAVVSPVGSKIEELSDWSLHDTQKSLPSSPSGTDVSELSGTISP